MVIAQSDMDCLLTAWEMQLKIKWKKELLLKRVVFISLINSQLKANNANTKTMEAKTIEIIGLEIPMSA